MESNGQAARGSPGSPYGAQVLPAASTQEALSSRVSEDSHPHSAPGVAPGRMDVCLPTFRGTSPLTAGG